MQTKFSLKLIFKDKAPYASPQKNAITFRVGYPFGSNDETNMAYDDYYDYFVDYNLDFEISNLFSSPTATESIERNLALFPHLILKQACS